MRRIARQENCAAAAHWSASVNNTQSADASVWTKAWASPTASGSAISSVMIITISPTIRLPPRGITFSVSGAANTPTIAEIMPVNISSWWVASISVPISSESACVAAANSATSTSTFLSSASFLSLVGQSTMVKPSASSDERCFAAMSPLTFALSW